MVLGKKQWHLKKILVINFLEIKKKDEVFKTITVNNKLSV